MKTVWLVMISGGILILFVTLGWQKSLYRQEGRQVSQMYATQAENTPSPTRVPSPTPTPRPIVLLFGGDVMWDRHIRQGAQTNGGYDYVVASIQPVLAEADMVVVNLEGPVTDNRSVSVGSKIGSTNNYIFTFDPAVVETMKASNMRVVNIGNNHILNLGEDGLTQTYTYLGEGGIEYFGDVRGEAEFKSLIKDIRGYTVGLVNYNQFVTGSRDRAMAEIVRLDPVVDTLVVYPHWGIEYAPESNEVIKQLAREMVEAGADIIMGSHPHVVQDNEEYMGVPIYYSLGNIVFDQYFQPEVKQGVLVRVKIDPVADMTHVSEIPIEMVVGGETRLVE